VRGERDVVGSRRSQFQLFGCFGRSDWLTEIQIFPVLTSLEIVLSTQNLFAFAIIYREIRTRFFFC